MGPEERRRRLADLEARAALEAAQDDSSDDEDRADIRSALDDLRLVIEAALRERAEPASGEVRMAPARLAALVIEAISRELEPEAEAPPPRPVRLQ